MTEVQAKRVKKDWENIAGEEIQLVEIGSSIYGFGSELATLKLLKAYRHSENARQDYSENLKGHYFRLD